VVAEPLGGLGCVPAEHDDAVAPVGEVGDAHVAGGERPGFVERSVALGSVPLRGW
jgi:hypothetical protein